MEAMDISCERPRDAMMAYGDAYCVPQGSPARWDSVHGQRGDTFNPVAPREIQPGIILPHPDNARSAVYGKDPHIKWLGKGQHSFVYKAEINGDWFAIKVLNERSSDFKFEKERTMLLEGNRHFVRLVGSNKAHRFFVLELCSGGSLLHHIEKWREGKKPRPSNLRVLMWAWEIACGMVWLHGRDLVHGDLAMKNILLDGSGETKISDLGLSFVESDKETTGTLALMAPEVLLHYYYEELKREGGHPCSKSSDVHSFGMTLWCLLEGCTEPQYSVQLAGSEAQQALQLVSLYAEGNALKCYSYQPAMPLIKGCLQPKGERPTFSQIRDHLVELVWTEAVGSENGSALQFWRSRVSSDETCLLSAPADVVMGKLCDYLQSNGLHVAPGDQFMQCLRLLLGGSNERIKVASWAKITETFFDTDLKQMCQKIWAFFTNPKFAFWVSLDADGAKLRLKDEKPGTYLIRFGSQRRTFTLSFVNESRQVINKRLSVKNFNVLTIVEVLLPRGLDPKPMRQCPDITRIFNQDREHTYELDMTEA